MRSSRTSSGRTALRVNLLSLLIIGFAAPACGPTLRDQTEYTPQTIKALQYSDACRLQGFFAKHSGPSEPESESAIGITGDAETKEKWSGRATFKLREGAETKVFLELLNRLYESVPPRKGAQEVRTTVTFYARGEGRRLPIGARIQVAYDDDEFGLPYHPCVGELLFGKPFYKIRGRLVHIGGGGSSPVLATGSSSQDRPKTEALSARLQR